jgi:transcriptional regulator with XRE-family HTH domain
MARKAVSEAEKQLRKEIAYNLKRRTLHITQGQLSEMTGIPASTLSGYFTERSTITPGSTQKIADVLNIEKQDIDPRFREDDEPYAEPADVTTLLNAYNQLNEENKKIALDFVQMRLYEQGFKEKMASYSVPVQSAPQKIVNIATPAAEPFVDPLLGVAAHTAQAGKTSPELQRAIDLLVKEFGSQQ